MQGGNVNEFIDDLYYGFEQVFWYRGKKYFIQGLTIDDHPWLLLDQWEPPGEDYVWKKEGKDTFPVKDFLNAKIWDGRNFWEAQDEMEWVDC